MLFVASDNFKQKTNESLDISYRKLHFTPFQTFTQLRPPADRSGRAGPGGENTSMGIA